MSNHNIVLTGISFENDMLQHVIVRGLRLKYVLFRNCKFDSASIRSSRLKRVTFDYCTFEGVTFEKTKLNECTFSDCNFWDTKWDKVNGDKVEFVNCTIECATIRKSVIHRLGINASSLNGFDLSECSGVRLSFCETTGKEVDIQNGIFPSSEFYGCSLEKLHIACSLFTNVTFAHTTIKKSSIYKSQLSSATYKSGAVFTNVSFSFTDMSSSTVENKSKFVQCIFPAVIFGLDHRGYTTHYSITETNELLYYRGCRSFTYEEAKAHWLSKYYAGASERSRLRGEAIMDQIDYIQQCFTKGQLFGQG